MLQVMTFLAAAGLGLCAALIYLLVVLTYTGEICAPPPVPIATIAMLMGPEL